MRKLNYLKKYQLIFHEKVYFFHIRLPLNNILYFWKNELN